ncbi:hypothetical protein [Fulvivirga sedimenti]|uniref:DUF4369 domain-containing protein n=1 Tax=Fulvivirga sedimenti TaxID=2879465 RepID=A0A9X1HUL1_9BACT|nr:hypothetical protein [Fulvivirga sedimenti]MCA6074792.1 hypothetical protein [Fulvivirga sedimenti]MCA6075969.1 hypothetical protein [Fulvivirga sedimenti]MCA6077097.1 hypothetical protein [Fulvivirga sedimenti]
MKPLLTTLILVFSFVAGNAQINTFKILVQNGESEIQIGEVVTQLKKGMVLSGDFTLTVKEGAYLGLVHNSGHVLEIKESGKYDANDLYGKIEVTETNMIVTRYTDFILNREISEKAAGINYEIMRDFEPFSDSEVNLYIPGATELYGDKLALEWANESEFSIIRVMNMFEEVLLEERVEGQRTMLNLENENLKKEEILLVKVYQDNDVESKAVALKRIDHETRTQHTQNLNSLTSNISNSALLELISAAYFEDNNLLADAFTSYVNAMLLAPNVPDYRSAYNEFLIRHKLLKLRQ